MVHLGILHRRDFTVLKKDLPEKLEFVLNIRLSRLQRHLYKTWRAFLKKNNTKCQFTRRLGLLLITTHPMALLHHVRIRCGVGIWKSWE